MRVEIDTLQMTSLQWDKDSDQKVLEKLISGLEKLSNMGNNDKEKVEAKIKLNQ